MTSSADRGVGHYLLSDGSVPRFGRGLSPDFDVPENKTSSQSQPRLGVAKRDGPIASPASRMSAQRQVVKRDGLLARDHRCGMRGSRRIVCGVGGARAQVPGASNGAGVTTEGGSSHALTFGWKGAPSPWSSRVLPARSGFPRDPDSQPHSGALAEKPPRTVGDVPAVLKSCRCVERGAVLAVSSFVFGSRRARVLVVLVDGRFCGWRRRRSVSASGAEDRGARETGAKCPRARLRLERALPRATHALNTPCHVFCACVARRPPRPWPPMP